MPTQEYSVSYNSFSGVDMQATFAGVRIGEIQGISFTVTREKAPMYTMGTPDCRGYSRGKRGIAGSMVFLTFDRAALIRALGAASKTNFMASYDQISQEKLRAAGQANPAAYVGSNNENAPTGIAAGVASSVPAWYPDQIPPFIITLNAINEYGHRMSMSIRGCEILNSGSGISIDDIMIDESMTFVATQLLPWRTEPRIDPSSLSNSSVVNGGNF